MLKNICFVIRKKNNYLHNIKFPVAHCSSPHCSSCVTMISIPQRYNVLTSGVQPRDHHR
ncbi:hypothetical protein HanRHA438_Chr10g0441081 [Helianthus annuus]|nr:hypothetical protein HanRHA438_Chr10g0441081 [Helianthus annuus]